MICMLPYVISARYKLLLPSKDVKFKDGDMIIAGQVKGCFEGSCLLRNADLVHLRECLSKLLPRYEVPASSLFYILKLLFIYI